MVLLKQRNDAADDEVEYCDLTSSTTSVGLLVINTRDLSSYMQVNVDDGAPPAT
jgi:hypothetical protein